MTNDTNTIIKYNNDNSPHVLFDGIRDQSGGFDTLQVRVRYEHLKQGTQCEYTLTRKSVLAIRT